MNLQSALFYLYISLVNTVESRSGQCSVQCCRGVPPQFDNGTFDRGEDEEARGDQCGLSTAM